MKKSAHHCIAATAVVLAMLAMSVRASHAEPVSSGNVAAELISEQETIRPGQIFTLGIALRPTEGWHTYWQNSGDSGLPTKVEWKLPEGFHAGDLQWPHPVRLGKAPFVTFGYESDALLLTNLEAPSSLEAGRDVDIVASVRWLACREDACVPGKAELPIRLRVEDSPAQPDSRWRDVFTKARSELPRMAIDWSATAREANGKILIDISAPPQARPSTTDIDVYPLMPGLLDASAAPTVRATENGFTIEGARDERAAPLPELLELVLVASGGWDSGANVRALRINAHTDTVLAKAPALPGAAAAAPAKAAQPADAKAKSKATVARAASAVTGGVSLWIALCLAFAGGLILNLMPCVFPVLSLKILGFVHVAHHEARSVRRHGYAFAAGVLVSFWVLAGILIALRAAGSTIGWGFQLQQPVFVALLAALLLTMALNLFGVFAIGTSITGAAGRFDSSTGYFGSFLSGVLATLLATPCSAPFMGTAVGYALVKPPLNSFLVFTSLGAGMAAPYLVLACVPMLMRRLPKPGAWMEHFRQAMAFPLLATVAWLVWVFGQQTGNDGVLGLLVGLLLVSTGAWIGGRFAGSHRPRVVHALAALCVMSGVATMVSVASPRAAVQHDEAVAAGDSRLRWQPWDPDSIGKHRSEGRVVFVDFTADWCLSCKVNERVALTGDDFVSSMRDANAIAMKADWTSNDPRITRALADFGRSGVPLYVIYPRDPKREPIVLPQILTPALVREALERALV